MLLAVLKMQYGIIPNKRKDIHMLSDRHRILELALESLENKKKQLDAEIAEITRELKGGAARNVRSSAEATGPAVGSAKKRSRFSKEERLRRSQRMKAYWENYRKKKSRQK
jgi:hypothetical protein